MHTLSTLILCKVYLNTSYIFIDNVYVYNSIINTISLCIDIVIINISHITYLS